MLAWPGTALDKGQSSSPEAEVVDGGDARQEDVESGHISGLQGLGGGLDDHGAPELQSIKGGVARRTPQQDDAAEPLHGSSRAPGVPPPAHAHPLQAVLGGALARGVPPTLEVDLHGVPLQTTGSLRSAGLPAGAARAAGRAEPGRFRPQLGHAEPVRSQQTGPSDLPGLPESVGRHALSSGTSPALRVSRARPIRAHLAVSGHVEEDPEDRGGGADLASQEDRQDLGATQELILGNGGIDGQGSEGGVDPGLKLPGHWSSEEEGLGEASPAAVPRRFSTILLENHVLHVQQLEGDAGVDRCGNGRRPGVFCCFQGGSH